MINRSSRPPEPLAFSAPRGRRLRFIAWLSFGIIAAFVGLNLVLAGQLNRHAKGFWWVVLAPASGLLVVIPIMIHARIHGYRLEEEELRVVRTGRINRFPPVGLIDVATERRVLEHAEKIWGNDGLGAITGTFRSSKLDKFAALVTDPEHAVVLRWPDRCLVVSPEPAEAFAVAVRARIKQRH